MRGRGIRARVGCAVAVLAVAGVTGCQGSPPTSRTVTLEAGESFYGLAVGSDGTVGLSGGSNVYRITPDASGTARLAPVLTRRSTGDSLMGVSTALDGTLWWTSTTGSGKIGGAAGHPADAAVTALLAQGNQARPALPAHWGNRFAEPAAVIDAQTVLVAADGLTAGLGGTTAGGQVWRVTASGAVPVLGKATPATRTKDPGGGMAYRITPTAPVQDIPAGQPVPADSVDIGRINAVVALNGTRFVAVATPVVTPAILADLKSANTDTQRQAEQRYRRPLVLIVDGGQLVRLEAPGLAMDDHPILSRLDGDHALLSASSDDPTANSRAFLLIDTATHHVTHVGQGPGVWVARTDGRVEVVTHPPASQDQVTLSQTTLP